MHPFLTARHLSCGHSKRFFSYYWKTSLDSVKNVEFIPLLAWAGVQEGSGIHRKGCFQEIGRKLVIFHKIYEMFYDIISSSDISLNISQILTS